MSEVNCNVVIEHGTTGEVKSIADFPLRIYNVGTLQSLTKALQSKELGSLATRDGSSIPAKLFHKAVLSDGRVNGFVVSPLVYTAIKRLKDFIAGSDGCTIRIYAHWANESGRYAKFA